MNRILYTLAALILAVSLAGAQFRSTNDTFRKAAKDTTIVKTSAGYVDGLIVEWAGSGDTVSVWDAATAAQMTEANRKARFVAYAKGTYLFGPEGIYLKNGITVSISGTTAGSVVFVYQ